MKYKKRPVIVNAFQVGYEPFPEWAEEALMDGTLRINNDDIENPYLIVKSLEGDMKAEFGCFIIKGIEGEVYPCRGDIFWKTYERIE